VLQLDAGDGTPPILSVFGGKNTPSAAAGHAPTG
jgi:hypothetical protein